MNPKVPGRNGRKPIHDRLAGARPNIAVQRPADQTLADTDQTAADADQTASDDDQSASATDQHDADTDQRASDRDQATADRDRATDADLTATDEQAYESSREERASATSDRHSTRLSRGAAARDRDHTASSRDRTADERDQNARARDLRRIDTHEPATEAEATLLRQLKELIAAAATDRTQAAADRTRAAEDRSRFSADRSRLESELSMAHLDELTGVYRREMGRLELSHEIDRARRGDGRFVLAFVDVDGLKNVNDNDGHAAGDHVLQVVVRDIRRRLRSYDPIIRYGGDEFVCGLSGTDVEEARRRFDSIGAEIVRKVRVGISVGLAQLGDGDSLDELTSRADIAMLKVKATHKAGGTRVSTALGSSPA